MKIPKKEHKRLMRLIRSGKIKVDHSYYLFTIDGIVMQMRGDMLPSGAESAESTAGWW